MGITEAITVLSAGSIVVEEKIEAEALKRDLEHQKKLKNMAREQSMQEQACPDDFEIPEEVSHDLGDAALDARLESKVDSMIDNVMTKIEELENDYNLRVQLKKLDLDRDGIISVTEIRIALSMLKDPPSEHLVRRLLRQLDPEESGSISLSELDAFANEITNKQDEETNKDERKKIKKLRMRTESSDVTQALRRTFGESE